MRYFLELAYNGTRFCGYQEQNNGITIQASIEQALATILRVPTKIVGCGRTDSGVHALQYYAHFDSEQLLTPRFVYRLNSVISNDIVFYAIHQVKEDAHARFDARSRSYQYKVDLKRNPFHHETAFYCRYGEKLNIEKMQAAAALLLEYNDFTTFCKSKTDVKTKLCDLRRSEWNYHSAEDQLIYSVTADRFLRGMIRLIVGMCLNVGSGKTELSQVKKALDQQKTLISALSAPPEGLYLMDIKYDFLQS